MKAITVSVIERFVENTRGNVLDGPEYIRRIFDNQPQDFNPLHAWLGNVEPGVRIAVTITAMVIK